MLYICIIPLYIKITLQILTSSSVADSGFHKDRARSNVLLYISSKNNEDPNDAKSRKHQTIVKNNTDIKIRRRKGHVTISPVMPKVIEWQRNARVIPRRCWPV